MRILVVQTAFLGDIALTTPLIGELVDRFHGAEITVLTTPAGAQLLKNDPRISGIIAFDKNDRERGVLSFFRMVNRLRRNRFDLAYGVQRSFRTSLLLFLARIPVRVGFSEARASFLYTSLRSRDRYLHDVNRNLSLVGADLVSPESHPIKLYPPEDSLVSDYVRESVDESTILLAPGSVWATKRWDWRNYRELAIRLTGIGRRVVLIGGPDEIEICNRVAFEAGVVNLGGRTNLQELMWCVNRSAAIVCNDSFALHLGSAFFKPTVAIFCATSPTFGFGPWNPNGVVVERSDLQCKPCARHGGRLCPNSTWACTKDLSVDIVLEKLNGVICCDSE